MRLKKTVNISLALSVIMIYAGMLSVQAAELEGAGTELNPFKITDGTQLRMIADFPDAYWELTDNIELSGNWTPVNEFSGNLDGNGYKISGLYLYDEENSWPNESAFILSNTGTLKNIHIDGTSELYSCNIGGSMFVKENSGLIENCSVKGEAKLTQKSTHAQNSSDFGGFVSENLSEGVIRNCYSRIYFNWSVINAGKQYLFDSAGFVNSNSGTIENCYSASYSKYSNDEFNGFKRITKSGTFENCYYDKDLTGIYYNDTDDFYNVFPKTTAAMKMQFNYSGWDFDNTWAIDDSVNDGYPYLKNERSIEVQVTGLSLDKAEAEVGIGKQIVLTPIFTPSNATNQDVIWSTSSKYVASVDNGVVTGVSEGTATITAESVDGGYSSTCKITVTSTQTNPDYPQGSCGDNMTWSLSDGVLTISGSGNMEYDGYDPPWADYYDEINEIVIGDGVETIKENAFAYTNITEVNIPSSVTDIGTEAFGSCHLLKSINVSEGNTAYSSYDGVLFNKAKTVMVQYPSGKQNTVYYVPDGVKTILTAAIYSNSMLEEIYIPDSVTDIEYYAISSTNQLTVYGSPGGAAEQYVSDYNSISDIKLIFSATSETEYDYTVNYVTGNIPDSGKFRAETNITKNSDTDTGVIIIALYDADGAMADYIFIDGDFEQGKSYTLGGTMNAFPGANLKAFVWNGLNTMRPISNIAYSGME